MMFCLPDASFARIHLEDLQIDSMHPRYSHMVHVTQDACK
jgi:hypothetical protein